VVQIADQRLGEETDKGYTGSGEGDGGGSAVERLYGRVAAGKLRGIYGGIEHGKRTFEEVFTEAGIIPQWMERGEEKKALAIARNLLAMGWAVENIAKTTELPLEKVRSLISL
jgi:predicted transposase YdaD